VPVQGGLPEKLPVAYGEFGAISPDGRMLAYTPVSTDFATWKRYRGGMAPDVWLFDLANKTAENITKNEAKDSQPMWHGTTVYFLSDRDGVSNVWSYNTKSQQLAQVTHFTDFDVKAMDAGAGTIVFEQAFQVHELDPKTARERAVPITVTGALVASWYVDLHLGPGVNQLVLTARNLAVMAIVVVDLGWGGPDD